MRNEINDVVAADAGVVDRRQAHPALYCARFDNLGSWTEGGREAIGSCGWEEELARVGANLRKIPFDRGGSGCTRSATHLALGRHIIFKLRPPPSIK